MSERRAPVRAAASDLQRFVVNVLRAIGAPDAVADDMAGQIVGSELAGHESHGLRRLPEYVRRVQDGYADPSSIGRIDLDRGALVRIDGERGFGHAVMSHATRVAIERAGAFGIAAVAVHDSEYAGRLVDFCERAAEAGIATLVFANDGGAGQVVAPPGGREGRLSTNPIAFGFPREAGPHLVLDMATSATAMGRVSEWRDRGESLPGDWVNGAGALLPFGGAKGFGLALIAEALGGALTTAGTVSAAPAQEAQGVLLIAIDVAVLRPLAELTAEVERFLAHVRDVPLEDGAAPVRFPGEGTAATARERTALGTPVQRFTWDEMRRLAAEFGVDPLSALPE